MKYFILFTIQAYPFIEFDITPINVVIWLTKKYLKLILVQISNIGEDIYMLILLRS